MDRFWVSVRFGNESNIHFVGRHSKSDLPPILSRMSLLINPWLDRTVYRHGISPNKWIDYLSAGKPILASFGGFRFLLEDQHCGWFIPPQKTNELHSAIVRIAAMPAEQLEEMGRSGRKYLDENLQYSILAGQLRSVIDSVCNCCRSPAGKPSC